MNDRIITPEDREFLAALNAREERRAAGQAAYEALKVRGRLKDHRLTTYRCAVRGCLLLDVVQLPAPVGRVNYQPVYKLSSQRNEETSVPAARAKNTVDGDRRWKPQVQMDAAVVNYTLSCDHLQGVALPADRVEGDLACGLRSVIITREDHQPEEAWSRLPGDGESLASWRIVED